MASDVAPQAVKELAPTGRLRAAINYGNPVLAQREPSGDLKGVSVDLARELGRRLGVPVDLVPFEAAGKVADAPRPAPGTSPFLPSIPDERRRSPSPRPTS